MASVSDVLTATGLYAFLEERRRIAMRSHDELHEAAALLQRGIQNMQGTWWKAGVDKKIMARRLTRPLRYAADVEAAKAKALATTWAMFQQSLARPEADKKSRTAFDPSK